MRVENWLQSKMHRRHPIKRKRIGRDVQDGHHRLTAIILTGIAAECYVTFRTPEAP